MRRRKHVAGKAAGAPSSSAGTGYSGRSIPASMPVTDGRGDIGQRVQTGSQGGAAAGEVDRNRPGDGNGDAVAVGREVDPDCGTRVAPSPGRLDFDHLSRCWTLIQRLFGEITRCVPDAMLALSRKGVVGAPWRASWQGQALKAPNPSFPNAAAVTLVAMIRDMRLSASEMPVATMSARGSLQLDVFDTDEDAIKIRLTSAVDVARFCHSRQSVSA